MSKPKRDPAPFTWPRLAEDGVTPLGIDLVARAHEVRKLVLAETHPPPEIDRDDLIQDVLLAIHRKNRQGCAFDPRRGGFAKYVIRVAECRLIDAIRALRRSPEPVADSAEQDVADPEDLLDALHEADEGTANIIGSRELGEVIPRAPRPIWRLALEQREAEARLEDLAAQKREEATPWQVTLFSRAELGPRQRSRSTGRVSRTARCSASIPYTAA